MRFSGSVSLTAIAIGLVLAPSAPALAEQDSTAANALQDAPASAQAGQAPPGDDDELPTPEDAADTILVIADSLRGTVDTEQPAILELSEQDIAAYGAGSIAELISALGDTAGSGRGQGGGFPVILVNGIRISSFRELRSYPPEAIDKIEVFPEEVAQEYGYSADQRVVNIILKRNYSSREIELEYGQPFDGGTSTKEIEGTLVQIAGQNRLNINLGYETSSMLTEAERDIIQTGTSLDTVASDPDPAQFRSLVSDSDDFEADINWATSLGTGSSISLNGSYERSEGLRLQGLDTVVLTNPAGDTVFRQFGSADPLLVDSLNETYAAAASFNTGVGEWQLTATLDGSRAESSSEIERRADTGALVDAAEAGDLDIFGDLPALPDAGFDSAKSTTDSFSGKTTLNGQPIYLPAGDVSITLDGGFDWMRIEREDTRNPGGPTALKRGNLNGGINANVPLTRSYEFLGAVGDTSLQLSAGVDHLSDFGTLYDWSAGLNWSPIEWISVNANYTGREQPPSLSQLGNPEIATPNVQVFDLTRNETVLATIISGGNPNLPAQKQSNFNVGANLELPFMDNARFSIEYYDDHSDNVTAGFPTLTPVIEAAFPGRVTRDASGRLVQLDQRPVTFTSRDSRRIQVGLNLGGPFGAPREGSGPPSGIGAVFGAISGGGGPQGGPPGGQGQGATQSEGQGQGGPAGPGAGQFNPEQFQAMRERLCAAEQITPEMLAEVPEFMRQRFLNEDGSVNQDAIAQMRERMCSEDGPAGFGPPGSFGGEGGGFDPAIMTAFREKLCTDQEITLADLQGLPERMREALIDTDGTLALNRVQNLREQVCQQQLAQAEGEGSTEGRSEGARPEGEGQQRSEANRGGGEGQRSGPPGGRQGNRGGGRGGPPGGGDGRGRWFANLNYTYALKDEILVAPGGPLLDLLDGDALGGSGRTRHAASLNGGFFYAGFGARYSVDYTGSSTLEGSALPGSTDLTFHDYVTVDLRLFADLNERTSLIESVPLLSDTRISIGIDNLFDARQRVTDSNGVVPLRYQPFLIDPIGRSFEIEFRKLF